MNTGFSFDGDLFRWVAGLVLAAAIAVLAWRGRSLTADGAAAAIAVGGIVVGAGGWWLGTLLVLFFVTSSALSRLRERARADRKRDGITTRGSRRDAVQVLANGGAAALGAMLFVLTDVDAWVLGAVCGIAAANADTWSTEIGRWVGRPPRLITTGRRVPPGTSGGVTVPGTSAALAGAGLIALGAALGVGANWLSVPAEMLPTLLTIVGAGSTGALIDSVLGATVQRVYRCPRCQTTTEQSRHRCGTPTIPVQGWPGVTNDTVNALATMLAAGIGTVAGLI